MSEASAVQQAMLRELALAFASLYTNSLILSQAAEEIVEADVEKTMDICHRGLDRTAEIIDFLYNAAKKAGS